jgi:Sec-independent protein secretion pathway component TatC
MSSEPESLKSWAMSFWEHIDELVHRLKVVLVTLIIAIGVGWIPTSLAGITNPVGSYQPMIAPLMVRLKDVFLPKQATLIAGGMADTVFAMAYLSVIIGVLLASPVIFYEVIAFIKPALYDNEKKVLGYYLGSFIGLLALGVTMAYFFVIPISFRILIYFTIQGGATPFIFIKDFYNWIYTIFTLCFLHYPRLHHYASARRNSTHEIPKRPQQTFRLPGYTLDILDIWTRSHPDYRPNYHGTLRRCLRDCNIFRPKNRKDTQKKKRSGSLRHLWNSKNRIHSFSKERLQILQFARCSRHSVLPWM